MLNYLLSFGSSVQLFAFVRFFCCVCIVFASRRRWLMRLARPHRRDPSRLCTLRLATKLRPVKRRCLAAKRHRRSIRRDRECHQLNRHDRRIHRRLSIRRNPPIFQRSNNLRALPVPPAARNLKSSTKIHKFNERQVNRRKALRQLPLRSRGTPARELAETCSSGEIAVCCRRYRR